MRIAIVNWSSRRAGGVEAYLDRVIGGLHSAGHETAFFCELDSPVSRQAIRVPAETPLWCASEIGNQAAISALRNWRPDIIYAHGLMDPALEAATLGIAPGVFFAHSYRGTCISGAKTFKFPAVRPCSRQFGWQCLMHFYPRRCGGLNPITMLNDFRLQSRRLSMLRSYCAIATASEYMREEYLRHGFASETVTEANPCLRYSSRIYSEAVAIAQYERSIESRRDWRRKSLSIVIGLRPPQRRG